MRQTISLDLTSSWWSGGGEKEVGKDYQYRNRAHEREEAQDMVLLVSQDEKYETERRGEC